MRTVSYQCLWLRKHISPVIFLVFYGALACTHVSESHTKNDDKKVQSTPARTGPTVITANLGVDHQFQELPKSVTDLSTWMSESSANLVFVQRSCGLKSQQALLSAMTAANFAEKSLNQHYANNISSNTLQVTIDENHCLFAFEQSKAPLSLSCDAKVSWNRLPDEQVIVIDESRGFVLCRTMQDSCYVHVSMEKNFNPRAVEARLTQLSSAMDAQRDSCNDFILIGDVPLEPELNGCLPEFYTKFLTKHALRDQLQPIAQRDGSCTCPADVGPTLCGHRARILASKDVYQLAIEPIQPQQGLFSYLPLLAKLSPKAVNVHAALMPAP